MASNIPLGTFLEDGLRTGPLYSGEIPNGTGPNSLVPFNPPENLSYSSYSAYGPGVLLSTQHTWNITPAPTTNANIVGTTAAAGPTQLTLLGDNVATRLFSQSNAPTYVQFDWPRVPTVTISANNLAAPLRVTIFGYDYYGIPMQHTYVVQNIGTYPTNINGSLSSGAKAFYSVTEVTLSSALTNAAAISVGASDVFGLPYVVNNAGDITSIGWGNSSDLEDNNEILSSPVIGRAVMVGSTVTVNCNAIEANSNIQVSRVDLLGGAAGNYTVPSANRVANTHFVIDSDGAAENSTIDWLVINPTGKYSASGNSSAMVAGVVVIPTSQVQSNSNIQLSVKAFAGAGHGEWYVSSIIPGISFTVTSTNAGELSTVAWVIMPTDLLQGTSDNLVATAGGSRVFVSAPNVKANSNILLTYANNVAPVNGGVLSAPSASINTIQPGIGFTIVSSNAADASQVNWVITDLLQNLTQGTATLAAGTVLVPTTSVAANSIILLSYNTLIAPGPGTHIEVSAIVAGTSFTITAQGGVDLSTINWAIFPANFFLSNFVSPLGTFIPADQSFAPTSTTGDVRGLYGPSTPSNGVNVLRFTSYVQGADQWINQVSNNQFLEKALNQPVVGTTVNPLTPQNLYGYPEFYTGITS